VTTTRWQPTHPCGIPGCSTQVVAGDAAHWRAAHSLRPEDLADAFAAIDAAALTETTKETDRG